MTRRRGDLHTGNEFVVRDFIVTREGSGNFLMGPYYAEAGGTVLDWAVSSAYDSSRHWRSSYKSIVQTPFVRIQT